jgi:hypothetical protein
LFGLSDINFINFLTASLSWKESSSKDTLSSANLDMINFKFRSAFSKKLKEFLFDPLTAPGRGDGGGTGDAWGGGDSSSDYGRGHTGESGDTGAGSGCNHTDAGGVSGTDAAAGERLGRRTSGAAAMSVLRRGGTGGRGAGDGGSGADTGGNGGSAGIYTI